VVRGTVRAINKRGDAVGAEVDAEVGVEYYLSRQPICEPIHLAASGHRVAGIQ
jgi:hypothetical protein